MRVNEDTAEALARMPKVELHHHLEGAAPPEFVRELAAKKKLDISHIFDADGGYEYRDFLQFLNVYEAATAPLRTPDDYAKLTTAVLQGAREHNIIYIESFLSPHFCGAYDVVAWKEYLHAMDEAARAVPGIALRGIVTAIRHFGPDRARDAAKCAQETVGDFIVGFGLAGDENAGHPNDFVYAFDAAREAGLRLTAHAGEWGGAKSVRDAIDHLKIERVGHGVQAIDDPKLVDYLVAAGIVLEVCPWSNIALGVYSEIAKHPIAKLREAGVRVTVSTDDPPFFHTDMTAEYLALAEAFDWGLEDFRALGLAAADAAFCDKALRDKMKKTLETWHA